MSEASESEVARLRGAIIVALGYLEYSDEASAVVELQRALEPPPIPGEQEEPPLTTAQREYEMRKARERCSVAVGGHLFYANRDYCARCFEPKPFGWGT